MKTNTVQINHDALAALVAELESFFAVECDAKGEAQLEKILMNASRHGPNAIQRFPVGTKFQPLGKNYQCTVTDFHVTRNLAGEVVKAKYVATHLFLGQTVTSYDVADATIARGMKYE